MYLQVHPKDQEVQSTVCNAQGPRSLEFDTHLSLPQLVKIVLEEEGVIANDALVTCTKIS